MEVRRIMYGYITRGHLHTVSTLFSMFSNLESLDEFANEYEIPSEAKPIVDVLLSGLKRDVNVRYIDGNNIVPNPIERNNKIVVAFSGGKDSVSTAMKYKNMGKDVQLFYVSGINKSYPDEMEHAQTIAKTLGLPLHIDYVKQGGKTSFKESPIKNQIIASMALNFAVEHCGCCSVAFGDFVTDNVNNSQFYESWSDTQEMWDAWLELVRLYVPNVELLIPFNTYNETLDIITDNKELQSLTCSCILPYRFRKMTREGNIKKYNVDLLPNRCGSCWKCCTEYIFMVDKGVVPINEEFYKHCLDFLKSKLPSVRPEISPVNIKTAYEAFLHRDFSESIINKNIKSC